MLPLALSALSAAYSVCPPTNHTFSELVRLLVTLDFVFTHIGEIVSAFILTWMPARNITPIEPTPPATISGSTSRFTLTAPNTKALIGGRDIRFGTEEQR